MHYIWCGTWSVQDAFGGAIGMLTNESAEICTTPFVPSWNRLHYVHPMTEQAQFRAVCMFRTPHNAGIKAAVFLEPFMPSVWFAFMGLLMFAGVMLWLIFRLERRWMQRCLDFMPSLLSSCLISFGAACIQGSYLMPKSAGGRLAFIAVMLTSFLMYNYYTSIVVAMLLGSLSGPILRPSSNWQTAPWMWDSIRFPLPRPIWWWVFSSFYWFFSFELNLSVVFSPSGYSHSLQAKSGEQTGSE